MDLFDFGGVGRLLTYFGVWSSCSSLLFLSRFWFVYIRSGSLPMGSVRDPRPCLVCIGFGLLYWGEVLRVVVVAHRQRQVFMLSVGFA